VEKVASMSGDDVAMKVFGEPITRSQVEAIKSVMTGDFRLADMMTAASRAGLKYRVCYRAIDRIFQKERKAGRIEYVGQGKWRTMPAPPKSDHA
jgi:hypothetical protein